MPKTYPTCQLCRQRHPEKYTDLCLRVRLQALRERPDANLVEQLLAWVEGRIQQREQGDYLRQQARERVQREYAREAERHRREEAEEQRRWDEYVEEDRRREAEANRQRAEANRQRSEQWWHQYRHGPGDHRTREQKLRDFINDPRGNPHERAEARKALDRLLKERFSRSKG